MGTGRSRRRFSHLLPALALLLGLHAPAPAEALTIPGVRSAFITGSGHTLGPAGLHRLVGDVDAGGNYRGNRLRKQV